MKPIDELLIIEEAKWRAKSYKEIESILDNVQYYEIIRENVTYGIEVLANKNKGVRQNEIVVRVDCSRFVFGKAKYFVISEESGARDIENHEAF